MQINVLSDYLHKGQPVMIMTSGVVHGLNCQFFVPHEVSSSPLEEKTFHQANKAVWKSMFHPSLSEKNQNNPCHYQSPK